MTTKTELLKIMRKFCVECMGGGRKAVQKCTSTSCLLFAFRLGSDPKPNKNKVLAGKERMKQIRKQEYEKGDDDLLTE